MLKLSSDPILCYLSCGERENAAIEEDFAGFKFGKLRQ